jgi:hypothetical protein
MAAMPALALPTTAATASRSAWSQAYARFRSADVKWDAFIANTHNPAMEALDMRAPMPKLSWKVEARSGQVASFYFDSSRPDEWDDASGVIGENGRRVKAEYQAWRERYDAISREIGIDAIDAEESRMCDTMAAAREAALAAPVGSISELIEKTRLIKEQYDGGIQEEHLDLILADLRRLAKEDR